jgi:hypothetical protein
MKAFDQIFKLPINFLGSVQEMQVSEKDANRTGSLRVAFVISDLRETK